MGQPNHVAAEIRSLQRQVRQMRTVTAICLLAVGTVAVAGWVPGPQETMSAKQYFVLDENGVPRGSFGLLADGASIGMMFTDAVGTSRIEMRVDGDGTPQLTVRDADQRIRLEIAVSDDGTPRLVFADHNELPRAAMSMTGVGATQLIFLGADGSSRRGAIGTIDDGRSMILLSDEAGETTFEAPIPPPAPPQPQE